MKPDAVSGLKRRLENEMTEKNSKRPTHLIWQVIGEGENAIWIRVGAAWENRDRKGLSVRFDAYPVAGRTVIREAKDPEAESRA
jgi:hypothetical protein